MAGNIGELLQRKYQILGEQADSERNLRAAQSNLLNSQAATNPEEAAARTAAGFGQAAQGRGFGDYYSALGAVEPGLATSEIGLRGAQAGQLGAEAESTRATTAALGSQANPFLQRLLGQRLNSGFGDTGASSGSGFGGSPVNNYAHGTDKVPGKMPPKGENTDTQPAMLTPGEAVLNRGAAEHLGRDVIDVLNAIGNIKMSSDGNASTTSGPATKADIHGAGGIPGYAQGSAGVGKIDPVPGQGGTWVTPDAIGASGNTSLRNSLGLGVPRETPAASTASKPRPSILGFAHGTSDVMAATHADAARNAKAGTGGKGAASPKGSGNSGGAKKGASGHGKPGKGGSKITPEMMQTLMNLGKGGGGLIPPGQGTPMPMPMPMMGGQGG